MRQSGHRKYLFFSAFLDPLAEPQVLFPWAVQTLAIPDQGGPREPFAAPFATYCRFRP